MPQKQPRVTRIDFDDEELPEEIHLVLPVEYAARIVRVLGKPTAEDGLSDVYVSLDNVFNLYWEDGARDVVG